MACEIHLNDIGTMFEVTMYDCKYDPDTKTETKTILNLSTATLLEIIFKRPDGTALVVTAELLTDGTDGKMYYLTVDGDLNQLKNWSIQGRATYLTGKWHSTIATFVVLKNLV